jgi:hypothetical protein
MWKDLISGKLSELEDRKQHHIEVSNRFAALEIYESEDINRAWENKEHIKPSDKDSLCLHELKQHKSWFDEECLRFLDQRKQAKMQ